MGNEASSTAEVSLPRGVKRMTPTLTKAKINLRVLIRGDRGVGKSALFGRLSGDVFKEEHFPTPEIQVTHIPWNFKTLDEIVKVEIWDVVDKGLQSSDLHSLLIKDQVTNVKEGGVTMERKVVADASSVDIYRGTSAVILIVDPTRKWTLDYVEAIIPEIPDIPVLILVNFMDLKSRHVLSRAELEKFLMKQRSNVRMLFCSMKDCFGLKELHNFLNIPYLNAQVLFFFLIVFIQKSVILGQLAQIDEEIKLSYDETDAIMLNQDYEVYSNLKKSINSALPRLSVSSSDLPLVTKSSDNFDTPAKTLAINVKTNSAENLKAQTINAKMNSADISTNQVAVSVSTTNQVAVSVSKITEPVQIVKSSHDSHADDITNFKPDVGTLDDFLGDTEISEPVIFREDLGSPSESSNMSKKNVMKQRGMLDDEAPPSKMAVKSAEIKTPEISTDLMFTHKKVNSATIASASKSDLESFYDDVPLDSVSGPSFDDFEEEVASSKRKVTKKVEVGKNKSR